MKKLNDATIWYPLNIKKVAPHNFMKGLFFTASFILTNKSFKFREIKNPQHDRVTRSFVGSMWDPKYILLKK